MAQKFDIPPRTFFANVLRAVIRHIVAIIHRLDPVAAVPLKPTAPGVLPRLAFAIAPQRVNMVAVPSRILFQRVEIRDTPHFRPHELFVAPLRRPHGSLPGKRHVRNDLPRCQGVNPIAHLDIELRGLEPQIRFDVSGIVHSGLRVDDISTDLSDKDGLAGRAVARSRQALPRGRHG